MKNNNSAKKVVASKKPVAKKPVAKKSHLKVVPLPKGKAKETEKTEKNSWLSQADAKRCEAVGLKAYTASSDPDGMPYVISAGQFVTNWDRKASAHKLIMALAKHIESQKKVAAAEASAVSDDDEVADDE